MRIQLALAIVALGTVGCGKEGEGGNPASSEPEDLHQEDGTPTDFTTMGDTGLARVWWDVSGDLEKGSIRDATFGYRITAYADGVDAEALCSGTGQWVMDSVEPALGCPGCTWSFRMRVEKFAWDGDGCAYGTEVDDLEGWSSHWGVGYYTSPYTKQTSLAVYRYYLTDGYEILLPLANYSDGTKSYHADWGPPGFEFLQPAGFFPAEFPASR